MSPARSVPTSAWRRSSSTRPQSVSASWARSARSGSIYDGAPIDAPTTIVAKFPTQSPEVRAMMHPTRIYEREHRFYDELATEVLGSDPVRSTTSPVKRRCEASDERYMLLMEDLSSTHPRRPVGRREPRTGRARARGSRRASRRVLERRRSRERRLHADDQRPAQPGRISIYDASLPGFMEAFGDVIKPELEDLRRELRRHSTGRSSTIWPRCRTRSCTSTSVPTT